MRKIYLQVGYPKCFSTTLQRSYFEVHPEIAFGGVGIKDNISYANRDIEFVFESLLRYSTSLYYEKELDSARKSLNNFVENVPAQKAIVFSSEFLIFPFTLQQVDFQTCFNRVQELFQGYEIHILMVIRRQDSLLKSLYGEYVKMGYPDTYSEFIRWVWAYRDRNFWGALDYHSAYNRLAHIFSSDQIHLQYFEHWKSDPKAIINQELSRILEVSNNKLTIKNDNPSLTSAELKALLKINQENRRGMGDHILTLFENHRNRESLKRLEAGYTNDELFANVYAKRLALVKTKKALQTENTNFYKLSPVAQEVYEKMKQSWGQSNFHLKQAGIEIPKEYFFN